MIKKIFRLIFALTIILGIAISISNFFPQKTDAVMTEQLLVIEWIPGGYVYYCLDGGQGCYTVELPQ